MSLFKHKENKLSKIPNHIAFIMDGNGRWAQKIGMPRTYGHRVGVEAVKRVIKACDKYNIKVVTFFVFSTENWSRPKSEIDYIFNLAKELCEPVQEEYKNKNYKVVVSGDISVLENDVKEIIEKAVQETKNNDGLIINFAINYGSRSEIVYACNKLIEKGKKVTQAEFEKELYTCLLPEPDILVRTSGEIRVSNFMLYQIAYSEMFFPKKYWPDFNEKDVYKILREYQNRNRRFGKVD